MRMCVACVPATTWGGSPACPKRLRTTNQSMATVLSRGINNVVVSSLNGPGFQPQKEKKEKKITRWVVFSLSIRGLAYLRHKPVCLGCFHHVLPSPSPFRPQHILPQHTHTQGNGPSKIKLPGSPRWPPRRRSPVCVAHEPADLTSREGGRMERQPHACPLPNMCSVWVCVESRNPIPSRCAGGCHRRVRQDGE